MQSANANPFSEDDFLAACGISKVNADVFLEDLYENPFTRGSARSIKQSTKNRHPPPINSSGSRDLGGHPTALLIVAYNRPQYLIKVINNLHDVLVKSPYSLHIYISLGDEDPVTATMAASAKTKFSADLPDCPVKLLRFKYTENEGDTGYNHMAKHFSFAIKSAFAASGAEQLIVIEVGIE